MNRNVQPTQNKGNFNLANNNKLKSTKKWIYLTVIGALCGIIYLCAMNDEPYFIRQIQGEEFIGIWAAFGFGIIAAEIVVALIISITISKNGLNIAKQKIYHL